MIISKEMMINNPIYFERFIRLATINSQIILYTCIGLG